MPTRHSEGETVLQRACPTSYCDATYSISPRQITCEPQLPAYLHNLPGALWIDILLLNTSGLSADGSSHGYSLHFVSLNFLSLVWPFSHKLFLSHRPFALTYVHNEASMNLVCFHPPVALLALMFPRFLAQCPFHLIGN